MAYGDHFRLVTDVTAHMDLQASSIDAFLQSRYTGFFAVASAAVLELALKEIVISFAQKNHALFGDYVSAKYERINGRIGLDDIRKDHITPFGQSYLDTFKERIARTESYFLKKRSISIKNSYTNLLTCRHAFAHEGSTTAMTYSEVKQGFTSGKIVMWCLAKTLS